jgi:siroheme synthase-like protein
LDISGKKCVVVGAGVIGTRRANALLSYGASVTVVAPNISKKIDGVKYETREFTDSDLDGAFIAVTATDDKTVNNRVAELCEALGIYVSVADSAEKSSFWFPASCINENLNVGLISHNGEHSLVARAARQIRSLLEEL